MGTPHDRRTLRLSSALMPLPQNMHDGGRLSTWKKARLGALCALHKPCSDGQSLKLHPTYRRPRSLVRSCLEFHEFEWVQSGLNPLAYSTHVYGTLATAIAERRAEIRLQGGAESGAAASCWLDT